VLCWSFGRIGASFRPIRQYRLASPWGGSGAQELPGSIAERIQCNKGAFKKSKQYESARFQSRLCPEGAWKVTRTQRVKRRHLHVRQATPRTAAPLRLHPTSRLQGCRCLKIHLGRGMLSERGGKRRSGRAVRKMAGDHAGRVHAEFGFGWPLKLEEETPTSAETRDSFLQRRERSDHAQSSCKVSDHGRSKVLLRATANHECSNTPPSVSSLNLALPLFLHFSKSTFYRSLAKHNPPGKF